MLNPAGLPRITDLISNPGLFWLCVLGGMLIWLAFFLPIVLGAIVRWRESVLIHVLFVCYATIVVAGAIVLASRAARGTQVATLWREASRSSGALAAIAAAASLLTLGLVLRLTTEFLATLGTREIAKANRQMSSILESTTIGVIAMDGSWRVNFINRNALQLLKVSEEVLGKILWDVFPAIRPVARETLLKVMETRRPGSYEGYYEPLDLTTTAQAHPWDRGGVAIFFSDISQQKRLQRDLDWERVMREQRIEVLARLSGELAHEIRNPLAIIHACASDLGELATEVDTLPSEAVAESCTSILRTADRAIRILRGVEALAREGTSDPMEKAAVAAIVAQTVELVHLRYRTHGVALEVAIPEELPEIECREVQIGQVLMNLLNNAFDAVDASPASERWVRVEASLEGAIGECSGRLLIDVTDGGPGMTAEAREHLMETFYTTKPVGSGMGIGLSVSRAIAEDHGGTLRLMERDGHTCFRLSLPLDTARREEIAA
jgi:C4-dicarboxylate-specific signal transduction histidine kinase